MNQIPAEERSDLSIYHLLRFPAGYDPNEKNNVFRLSSPCMDTGAMSAICVDFRGIFQKSCFGSAGVGR